MARGIWTDGQQPRPAIGGRRGVNVRHHPSDETLVSYAAGTLEAGPAVVTESHLAACTACRARLAAFRTAGGALLDDLPPTPLAAEALALAQTRLDEPPPAPPARRAPRRLPKSVDLPASLRAYDFGRWLWQGPGVWSCRVIVPGQPKATARLLHLAPNTKIPEHGHTGREFTLVLSGSFSDGRSQYGPGDFSEADSEVDHQPIVDPDGTCVCIIAMEGQMRLHGVLGYLLQPLTRL